ncbi:hypothetical protein AKJ63_00210 [candidate division MSBL1 archaeon SCGC-AAA259D18]|uniref:Type II toxin-antitoxin system RelE/ParE family toxin n=2 Tax=candidate division MSBL1 TaxID=215777 RepID=A0A133UBY4_9EURY|nr:hypothetical protein AKJ57_00050 [candidate division MSBL1 archaeon SCGC-AAA259A05]KXA91963.1 hypothetical protein AKJ63_00210 [candidate division MSBL1 archaeon SCGC-AAA259D18]
MTFLLSPQFKKDVNKLPKSVRKRVRKALYRLRDEERGEIKKVEDDLWRLRVGDYRVYYYPKNNDTYVLRVLHRRHVYRRETIKALLKRINRLEEQ